MVKHIIKKKLCNIFSPKKNKHWKQHRKVPCCNTGGLCNKQSLHGPLARLQYVYFWLDIYGWWMVVVSTPLKNMKVSWDDLFPYVMEKIQVFQTNQILYSMGVSHRGNDNIRQFTVKTKTHRTMYFPPVNLEIDCATWSLSVYPLVS